MKDRESEGLNSGWGNLMLIKSLECLIQAVCRNLASRLTRQHFVLAMIYDLQIQFLGHYWCV